MPASNDIRERAGQIRDLVAGNHVSEATKKLLDLASDFSDSERRNEAIVISAEFRSIEEAERLGLIDLEKARTSRIRILYQTLALVDSIEEMPELGLDVQVEPQPDDIAGQTRQLEDSSGGESSEVATELSSEDSLFESAEALELAFDEKDPGAMARLADFADRFAVDRKLFHQTLLLWQQSRSPGNDSRVEEIADQARHVVRKIELDFRTNLKASEFEHRRARVEEAYHRVKKVAPPREIVLSCSGLGKRYRRSGFRLRGVNLDLRLGEITGVVGRNANGKTTLLRLLGGELRHDDGILAYPALNGHESKKIKWQRVKSGIAYLPQELPSWHGSLQNNLHFETALHGIRGKSNEQEVAHIVERLGLGNELDKRWKELSGGTKLRFALAKALAWKPKLLILDEPLASLDFNAQHVLLSDLLDLVKSLRHPMSVVISSQHLHEVEAISDHIIFLREGEAVYNGSRSAIGADRKENIFEIGVNCDIAELRDLLLCADVFRIYHSGIYFTVRTSLKVTAKELLCRLIERDVAVEYFRDISLSTRVLFE